MTEIKIVHVDPITREVSLELSSKEVTGMDKLVQLVVIGLLETPGRSVLDSESGGGLLDLIGTNLSLDDPQEIYSEVQLRVSKVESEIFNNQVGLDLDPEEKLKSLKLLEIREGNQEDVVFVRIRVINELGRIEDLAV